jgi:hypothetical protein
VAEQIHEQMKSKFAKIRDRRYIKGSPEIILLISFFMVAKEEDDV